MAHIPAFIQQIDDAWMGAFHTATNPALDWAAWILSTCGWLGLCWWVVAAVIWKRGDRLLAAQVALSMVVGGVLAEAVKFAVHRVRPSQVLPQYIHVVLPNLPDTHWSFPSGHAVLAASAAFAILFASHKRYAWWLVAVALLIGWSRIYEGMHWPSDVLAGFCIGIVAAVMAVVARPKLESLSVFNRSQARAAQRSAPEITPAP